MTVNYEEIISNIDKNLKLKRGSQELSPHVENEMNAIFDSFAPKHETGNESEYLNSLKATALISLYPPIDSQKLGGSQIKRSIVKLVQWYLKHIIDQQQKFNGNVLAAFEHILNAEEEVVSSQYGVRDITGIDLWEAEPIPSNGNVLIGNNPSSLFQSVTACYGDVETINELTKSVDDISKYDLRVSNIKDLVKNSKEDSWDHILITCDAFKGESDDLTSIFDDLFSAVKSKGTLEVLSYKQDLWENDYVLKDLVPKKPLNVDTVKFLASKSNFVFKEYKQDKAKFRVVFAKK